MSGMGKRMSIQQADPKDLEYLPDVLTIFVVGASGDLAKKKTYPSLFDLHRHGFLSERTTICGYARSFKSDEDFKAQIAPYIKHGTEEEKQKFLDICIYRQGAYDSTEDVAKVFKELEQREADLGTGKTNRLFYFAIPPSVFVPIGKSIKEAVVDHPGPRLGWTRLIVEKPFGKDTASFQELSSAMGALYTEDYIYRIDHYLGKEMVQNLVILRFANAIFEPLWNRNHIKSVVITFKEDFGTKGRGGYFDSYGIIRDVIQNHLLQVMSLLAMEPPVKVTGDGSANFVRDEKVKVLNCIEPVKWEDCVLGQYMAAPDGSEVAYTEDPTVPDDSVTPTFASMVLRIKNPRWDGVPFIIKAGKALNERKAEIRIQFKNAPGAAMMFGGQAISENELVMRLQPDEAVYVKTNVKSPGLATKPIVSELDLSYKERYDVELFDAYTRLILEVIRGRQATFVRDDELKAAWAIFTPLLHQIDKEKIKPIPYEYGGRGPAEADKLAEKVGYSYRGNYTWSKKESIGEQEI
jgi:glucose-6-phosphate 1-dehydrogenase